MPRRFSPRRKTAAKIALTLALLPIAALLFLISRISQAAHVRDAARADAVVVLGCAVREGGQPSPALEARAEEGVRVWRATGSHYLLLTGGVGRFPPAEAVVMAEIAAREGVPPSAMIEDTTAHRTEDSAVVCGQMARQRGWTRVVLVSDPWHLLRARQMFADANPALDIRQSPATDSPAWTNETIRFGYTLRECLALPIYLIKSRLGRHV